MNKQSTLRHCEERFLQRSNLMLFNLIEIASILKVRGFRNDAEALGIITDNHIKKINQLLTKYTKKNLPHPAFLCCLCAYNPLGYNGAHWPPSRKLAIGF
jgi:hypothetical protein